MKIKTIKQYCLEASLDGCDEFDCPKHPINSKSRCFIYQKYKGTGDCLKAICGTCAWHKCDEQAEDFVCMNPESERFAEWIGHINHCDGWKELKHE